jgi:hypothetical protein
MCEFVGGKMRYELAKIYFDRFSTLRLKLWNFYASTNPESVVVASELCYMIVYTNLKHDAMQMAHVGRH